MILYKVLSMFSIMFKLGPSEPQRVTAPALLKNVLVIFYTNIC
jgi:hypothetical protein